VAEEFAMKKRLPLLPVVMIGPAVFVLVGAITVWLKGKFELPDWIIPLSSVVAMLLFFEIVGRFGSAETNAPISKFLGLSIRDRIVTVAAILAYVVIAFPIGYQYDSVLFHFLFLALGVLALWLICFIFGSERLRRLVLLKKSE
jgi:hypothetical protein